MLALVFAVIVWQVGKPTNEADRTTTVGWVFQQTDDGTPGPAWSAGLRPGDNILQVDNQPVTHFAPTSADSVTWRIVTSTGTNIPITFTRGTNAVPQTVFAQVFHHETKWYERKALRQICITPAEKVTIYEIASNSPAERAGLKSGDEIVALDGATIYSRGAVIAAEDAMSNGVVKPLTITARRDGKDFDCTVTAVKPSVEVLPPTGMQKLFYSLHLATPPPVPKPRPLLGISSMIGDTNVALVHPDPIEQIQASVGQIANTFGALFTQKGDIGVQQLGGAVMILRVYSNLFDDEDGWRRVLWFSVILNVNLALLNLLPLPVLDGGHITLSLIEAIRRRPVSGRLLERIQTGFAALLITFMIYIAFFDTGDWIRSAQSDRDLKITFTPQK
jgi:regulator of sigma E protease